MQKHCKKCNTDKDTKDFYKLNSAKSGLQAYCIDCQNKTNREYVNFLKDNGPTLVKYEKVCKICNSRKPISQFGKKTSSSDGHLPYCKPCWIDYVNKAKSRQAKK